MESVGFGAEDLDDGWRRLRAACSAPVESQPARKTGDVEPKIAAFAKTIAPRTRTALRTTHPAQMKRLLDGLPAAHGATRVLYVTAFLDRCDALASGKGKTHKADLTALAALRARGLTDAARREARAWIARATSFAPMAAAQRSDDAALVALHAWVKDWSACARSVITRRDWLIRLGVGKRVRAK